MLVRNESERKLLSSSMACFCCCTYTLSVREKELKTKYILVFISRFMRERERECMDVARTL